MDMWCLCVSACVCVCGGGGGTLPLFRVELFICKAALRYSKLRELSHDELQTYENISNTHTYAEQSLRLDMTN